MTYVENKLTELCGNLLDLGGVNFLWDAFVQQQTGSVTSFPSTPELEPPGRILEAKPQTLHSQVTHHSNRWTLGRLFNA